ncbi:MAG: T9SS type A sorting domain-containing protein, partial [Bacteroidales bacterium]
LDSFCNHFADTNLPIQNKFYFRQVMIPIVREAFLQSSFQFRFRAKSSIDPHFRSGGGQWHIDYVYVNTGRSLADTVLRDIAIVETQPSLLKAYQKVPFKQFKPNMLKDTRSLLISNLYNTALSCKYQYTIANEQGDQIYAQPNSGEANSNLFPFITSGYTSDPDISKFPMSYPFDEVNAKEQNFTIRHIVKVDLQNDLIPQNDTLSFTQDFGNEFAYDDGTSEAGIGLTYPSFMAYKFTLNVADTLTAIRICFNHSYENNNEIGFKICVWNADSNGLPKNILYKSPITLPQITLPLNSFGKYILNTPLILEPGNFFVGIEQLSSDYLNFGYDQNRNACEQLFYYYMNDQNVWAWKNSIYYGSWMLRPAFGMGATIENDNISTVDRQSKQLIIYPNPLRNTSLNLRLPPTCDAQHSRVRIFDLSGRMLIDCNYQTQINLPSTKAGLYTVQLWDRKSGLSYHAKLIIVR